MSEVHHALLLGLEGEGKADAAEAIEAAGFTLVTEDAWKKENGDGGTGLTLFATPGVETKKFKLFAPAKVVCLSRFSGQDELSGIEKLKPSAILPLPGTVANWKQIYQQTLTDLKAGTSKKNNALLRSLYSVAADKTVSPKQAVSHDSPLQPCQDIERRFQAVQQEMQSFAYSVSHDLRAPLRAVYGFSKILADDFAEALPDEAKSFVNHIMANAQQMSSLLDDLLTFYRLGKNPPRKADLNPTEHTKLIAAELKQKEKERRIEVEVTSLPALNADPNLLDVALRQLLGNAIKFTSTKEQAVIKVSGGLKGDQAEITVQDNGVGFDMNHAAKLFQVFQRMHTSAEFPGNGIGLAMVKKVVDMHDGTVSIDSVPEQGTKVTLVFPRGAE